MNFILRVISLIITIFIVVPLCFLMYSAQAVFTIANNFTYYVFASYDAQIFEMIQQKNIDFKHFWILKLWTLIISPILSIFVNFINALKTIKF